MSTQALMTCLEELIGLHESLCQLYKEKTDVLVHNNIDELNRIVHRENQLIKKIAEWDGKRNEAVTLFLKEKGFRPDPAITMTELNKLVPNREEKRRLQELQTALLDKIGKLREVNRQNQRLIEQTLRFVDLSLDLLTAPESDDVIYHNPNTLNNPGKRAARFDTKA